MHELPHVGFVMVEAADGGTAVEHMLTGERRSLPGEWCLAFSDEGMGYLYDDDDRTMDLAGILAKGAFEPGHGQQLMVQDGDDPTSRLMLDSTIIQEPLQLQLHIFGVSRSMNVDRCCWLLRCSMGCCWVLSIVVGCCLCLTCCG